ncbi:MAG: DegQ family serine endoprotease [Proteobacteria bacterium]|nr:DegQ family serine endoprotease [Pseudomonadota bacterium]
MAITRNGRSIDLNRADPWRTIKALTIRTTSILVLGVMLANANAVLPQSSPGAELPSLAPMLENVTPAVVNIATEGHVEMRSNPLLSDPFFRRFFNVPQERQRRKTQSLGSGVIIDAARGLVVTNNHVIANADQITVKLRDGRNLKAELIGSDPDTDVAVVKISAERLTAVQLADSDRLRVGDYVVAIGNPFGLGQTVTSGIISALARSGLGITGYEDLIQTDASINPGNSGGALVNLRGELVGINTAIYSQSGGNIGIGFAIPTNMVRQITDQLVDFGEVRRGFLGAQLQDLDPDLAAAFGLKTRNGAVLVNILEGSPAHRAGLLPGDVVTAVNEKIVGNASDLRNQVGLKRIGDTVKLKVFREGREKLISVTVEERQDAELSSELRNARLAGATFGEIAEQSPAYGRLEGVMIYEVEEGSRVAQAGLREGDIITSVNRTATRDLEEFLKVVNAIQGGMLLRVHRGNEAAFMVIK